MLEVRDAGGIHESVGHGDGVMKRELTEMETRVVEAMKTRANGMLIAPGFWEATAIAAIRAMREPTWDMLLANRVPCASGDCPGYSIYEAEYNRMIDAASPPEEKKEE